jgi:hypothetical protein
LLVEHYVRSRFRRSITFVARQARQGIKSFSDAFIQAEKNRTDYGSRCLPALRLTSVSLCAILSCAIPPRTHSPSLVDECVFFHFAGALNNALVLIDFVVLPEIDFRFCGRGSVRRGRDDAVWPRVGRRMKLQPFLRGVPSHCGCGIAALFFLRFGVTHATHCWPSSPWRLRFLAVEVHRSGPRP